MPADPTAHDGRSPRRGRRSVAAARRAIIDAATDLLFAEGLASVTFEKVAARSGASKATLYKWWPSPGALAFTAYFDAAEQPLAFPGTGDARADITQQLHAFVSFLTDQHGGPVIAELIGAAQADPDLAAELARTYTRPRRQLAATVLEQGQERGQIRSSVDPEVIIDQLWGACYHRLLLPEQPLTIEFADALIANLWGGIAGQR